MAGALTISTLNNDTGVLQTQNGMSGIPKAWVNFNGVSGASIRSAFNVSSITRNATGDYTVSFTTSMPNTNYATVTGMSGNASTSNGNEFYVSTEISGPAYNAGYTTTASIRMLCSDGTGTNRDCADLNLAVFSL